MIFCFCLISSTRPQQHYLFNSQSSYPIFYLFNVQQQQVTRMTKRQGRGYEEMSQRQDELSQEVQNLKVISSRIIKQLNSQKKSRQGLEQYLDAGLEGLRKTNQMLNGLLGTSSLFGCNTLLLFGIALLVIIVLILI